jgi:outer membrane protein OmpA-like peptidoglycan-associated protein
MYTRRLLLLVMSAVLTAADLPNSKDPPGMKRYTGSEIIGYRAPKFDEFLLPLGTPTTLAPPNYAKSLKISGQVSRYTYLAPAGRSPAEVFRNYEMEFQRLGLATLYRKNAGENGWFGPTLSQLSDEDELGQILSYNEAQERVLVGKTKDAKPAYYYVFVTAYKDGVIPHRLEGVVAKDRVLAEVIVVAPDQMEQRMSFVNADEMSRALADTGKVLLYGIYFDTDKDVLRPDSQPTLAEIQKLLRANPQLRIHVVGHTDNQGSAEHNLDLSRRRAASVAGELATKYGITPSRMDSFGCGFYAPVTTNADEESRAKNRRVELVRW